MRRAGSRSDSVKPSNMTDKLAPAYLIVGDDAYLISQALDEILSGASDLASNEFGPGADMTEVLQALDSASIFGDRRTVVVRDLDEMGAEAHRRIGAYLEVPNESVSLVMTTTKSLPKIAAAVRKFGRVIEAGRGKRTDLFGWLRKEAKARGLVFAGDSLGALVEAIGKGRTALAQAMDEFSLALGKNERLTPERVRLHFSGRADARMFGFVDAVSAREPGLALESLHQLLRQGEHPQSLFWMLARHFRLLVQVSDSAPGDLAGSLGLPAWRAEKLSRQARNFTRDELTAAYLSLAEADRKIKKSEEPEELTLERAVVRIAAR